MTQSTLTHARKKKIKTLLSLMNKQTERIFPIVQPLVEMMDLAIADHELDYLLGWGTGLYDYQEAAGFSEMSAEQFPSFFDTLKRKGLVHIEFDSSGKETYRLNAIAVGWYEAMMHYNVGKSNEKVFSEKWNDYFKYFQKFNFFPLRNVQNLVMGNLLKAYTDTGLMNPDMEGATKRKTIPIHTEISASGTNIYPTFFINDLIQEFGDQNTIYALPCVCRHGNSLIDSACNFDYPKDSCIAFGNGAKAWASWGYGRHVEKTEAMEILKEVRHKGAVHSVIHERDDTRLPVVAVCNCCWDCCSVLKPYNMGAVPLKYNASYVARIKDDANCKKCGNCEKFCPTTAMKHMDGMTTLNSDKCIGCGQCAYQCRQNNIELLPVEEHVVYLPILKKSEARISV
jgi:Pyruvate/2-oxoacid:ferredoxin oxidoreductase delta subunit